MEILGGLKLVLINSKLLASNNFQKRNFCWFGLAEVHSRRYLFGLISPSLIRLLICFSDGTRIDAYSARSANQRRPISGLFDDVCETVTHMQIECYQSTRD